MTRILKDNDGREVLVGAPLLSFRGEKATLTGIHPPAYASQSGKVSVTWEGLDHHAVYYASVFNLKFEEDGK